MIVTVRRKKETGKSWEKMVTEINLEQIQKRSFSTITL